MITRGVTSVRSPVRNLCWFQPDITHEMFVDAVVHAFQKEYGINEDVHEIGETRDILDIAHVKEGMDELPVRSTHFQ